MKTFKLIMVFVGIIINIAFYFAFFASFFDKSVGDTDTLLVLIAAMIMTMLIKQELNLKLGLIEANTKDVYGTIEFRCDYFCIDEEKYNKSKYATLDVAKNEE